MWDHTVLAYLPPATEVTFPLLDTPAKLVLDLATQQ